MEYNRDRYRRLDWLQFCKKIGAHSTAAIWSFTVGAENNAARKEAESTAATAESTRILGDIKYQFEVLTRFNALSEEKIVELQQKNAQCERKCMIYKSELEVLKSRTHGL